MVEEFIASVPGLVDSLVESLSGVAIDSSVVGVPVASGGVMGEDQAGLHLFNDFGEPGAYLPGGGLV